MLGYNAFGELGAEKNRQNLAIDFSDSALNSNIIRLGNNPDENYLNYETLDLSLGDFHACALIKYINENSENKPILKCWGKNNSSQTGGKSTEKDKIGDDPNEIIDLVALDFNEDSTTDYVVKKIKLGSSLSCVILDDKKTSQEEGKVRCWGLGTDDNNLNGSSENLPNASKDFKKISNLALGDDGSKDYKALKIITSVDTVCAFLETGKIKCWGSYNSFVDRDKLPKEVKNIFENNYAKDFCVQYFDNSIACGPVKDQGNTSFKPLYIERVFFEKE